MVKQRLIGISSAMALSLALTACGGGGSSSTTSNSTLTGQFIDAPVSGLAYSASPSGLSGTTDALGSFNYKSGDTVSFSIPGGTGSPVSLGSAPGAAEIHVLNLPSGLAVSEVLQTLDTSSDPSVMAVGGLTLPSATANSLSDFISKGGVVSGTTLADLASAVQAANSGVTFVNPTPSAVVTINGLVDQLSGSAQTPCTTSACTTLIDQASNVVTSLGGSAADVNALALPFFTFHKLFAYDASSKVVVTGAGMSYYSSTAQGAAIVGLGTRDPSPYTDTIYSVSGNVVSSLYEGDLGDCTPTTCSSDVNSYYSDPSGSYVVTDNNTDYTGGTAVHATAVGTATPLQTSLTLASLEGRTLAFSSHPSGMCSPDTPVIVSISLSGTYQSGCGSPNGGTGTVQDGASLTPAMPGMAMFTADSDGKKHAVALVTGSVGAGQSGTMAIVTLNTPGNVNDFNGIYAFTVQ